MKKKFVQDVDVRGKTVFVRNDFNVPLNKKQEITDDTRIRESLPTLRYLLDNGARIVCCSHLGRPKGEVIPECTLNPVSLRLSELLNRNVLFNGETVGPKAEQTKAGLKEGDIYLLENLRFHPGETKNDEAFARELAKGIDTYVDDAFGACHRAHASIEKITHFVPVAVSGFLLKKEIDYLSMATENPPEKYLLILGGAKVSDKIPLINHLLGKVRTILVGGAMAYTFLMAKGTEVGQIEGRNRLHPPLRRDPRQSRRKGSQDPPAGRSCHRLFDRPKHHHSHHPHGRGNSPRDDGPGHRARNDQPVFR